MPTSIIWIYALPVVLFALMVAGNPLITVAGAAPNGILDHQLAGTAARVGEIHQAWKSEAGWFYVQALIGLDLLFIPTAYAAFWFGARTLWGHGVRALGAVTVAGGLAALVTDFVETGAQGWQVFVSGPQEGLAGLAAAMVAPKLAAYAAAICALAAGAVLVRLKK